MKPTQSKTTSVVVVVVVATLLLAAVAQVSQARKSKCPAERDREFDLCSSKMGFLGDHSFRLAKNMTGMNDFCSQLKESIACIQGYSRECLQGFTRQVLTSLLKRGKQQYNLICQDDTSKRDFMVRLSCLTDDKIETFHRCMDASVARFEYIAGKVPLDERMPALCCSYQIFHQDIESTLDRLCGKPASHKGSIHEFVSKVVSGTAGEFLGLICDGHRSMEECKSSAKTRVALAKLEDITKRVSENKLKPKGKSLVPVLLEILDGGAAANP